MTLQDLDKLEAEYSTKEVGSNELGTVYVEEIKDHQVVWLCRWARLARQLLILCDSELSAYAHGRLLDRGNAGDLSWKCRKLTEETRP